MCGRRENAETEKDCEIKLQMKYTKKIQMMTMLMMISWQIAQRTHKTIYHTTNIKQNAMW